MKIITPTEALRNKESSIPQEVFDAFNDLIAQNFDGSQSIVSQKQVAELAASNLAIGQYSDTEVSISDLINMIYKNCWLDVESVYERYEWDVTYDKVGYGDYGQSVFIFKKKD